MQRKINKSRVWGWLSQSETSPSCGLAKKLAQHCYKHFNGEHGEIDLLISVIIEAAHNPDEQYSYADSDGSLLKIPTGREFIYSTLCERYCEILGLPYLSVVKLIERIWTKLE